MVEGTPVGRYHYLKDRKNGAAVACRVDVFALHATGQKHDWPEKGTRQMAWLPPEQAAARVSEPGLRELLRRFGKDRAQTSRKTA